MTVVLDASALLAWFTDEPGAEVVEQYHGTVCSTANWAEVVQKLNSYGVSTSDVHSSVSLLGTLLEPVTVTDAEHAAKLWQQRPHLSLGDRLCLALAHRLQAPVLTADQAWGEDPPVIQIR
ncbi:MAG: type II toxin-antitoxin system VapC family toxin [Arachnia propionica]|uniref:type II toxin-antitoxin system VapC family toxin n=1 Tax=Arachnia propionica TaxID=1750 RepID=UPI0026F7C975|nr:type II toxin-antitoxin system VapC family toxin [Arachnia propionica]